MKKLWIPLLLVLLLFSGCTAPGEGSLRPPVPGDEVILPPCREGEIRYKTSWAHYPAVEEAVEAAEAVAVVTVGSWVGEDLGNGKTAYFAMVEKTYKGDLPETILLLQTGTSAETHYGTTLYSYGNELLVFLKPAGFEDYSDVYDSGVLTAIPVGRDDSGAAYLFDGPEKMMECFAGLENHGIAHDSETAWQIRRNFVETDPYWEDKLELFNVYKLSDAERLLGWKSE